MSQYLDKAIYERAKSIVDKQYKKPSAYRSASLLKTYRELGGRVKQSMSKDGLTKWLNQQWKNLTPYAEGLGSKTQYKCGEKAPKQNAPSVCRPLKDVAKFSKSQIKKAVALKKQGKTIQWSKL